MADEELRKVFARKLTYYLQLHGYSQADLARKLNVSTATTAKWATGQTIPRVDKIQSICNWLGIEKSDLLDDIELKSKEQTYYTDSETAKIAQEIFDDPDLRALFDAARNVKPEALQQAASMLKLFKETNKE